MKTEDEQPNKPPSIEERRLLLDERRLHLDNSFARKWLPTLATVMVGLVAAVFGYVQQKIAVEATERARIEAQAKDEREWGFKIVEMYFDKRDRFDLTKNADEATANLRMLVAVAPMAVQGLLNAEKSRIPTPGAEVDDAKRLHSLSAVADIQNALSGLDAPAVAGAGAAMRPVDFLAYIQYAEGAKETALKAQALLQKQGFHAPGVEQVRKVPSRLQVRYYRAEQRPFAAQLAIELGKALQLPATADSAVAVASTKQLPTGILEVWLPVVSQP